MNNQYAKDLSTKAKMYCWMLRAGDPPAITRQLADLLMELAEEVDILDDMNMTRCKHISKQSKKIRKLEKKLNKLKADKEANDEQ